MIEIRQEAVRGVERSHVRKRGGGESRKRKAYCQDGIVAARRREWIESQGSAPHPPRGVPPGVSW